jgi:hypothetical protein
MRTGEPVRGSLCLSRVVARVEGPATSWAANQKRQTVMIVTGVISDREYFSGGNLLSMEGSMIDAVVNVAIFATLGLCIVGFSAWAHKRVP